MEIITNENKAVELFPDVPNMECLCLGVREKLVEMAAWKDFQFKKYLQGKLDEVEDEAFNQKEHYGHIDTATDAKLHLLKEIIDDVFNEETNRKQDK